MRELVVQAFLIGSGGFLGALSRAFVGMWVGPRDFPIATLLVNGLGGLGIGVVAYLAISPPGEPRVGEAARLFLAVGFLGGLTTFSTFSAETLSLARDGTPGLAVVNVFANLGVALGACMLGGWLASVFAGPRPIA